MTALPAHLVHVCLRSGRALYLETAFTRAISTSLAHSTVVLHFPQQSNKVVLGIPKALDRLTLDRAVKCAANMRLQTSCCATAQSYIKQSLYAVHQAVVKVLTV